LPARTALLAEDETDLLLFPPVRAGLARRGQPANVFISGFNARRSLFGTLHLRSGHLLLLDQQRKRAQEFEEFLDCLRWHYRSWHIALLLDENAAHTADESQVLAEELDIELLWLPKRSPHLNPVDRLWGHGKAAVCANWQQNSIEDQTVYFIHYYQQLSPRERLTQAGMFSPDYWLYNI
jgi:transposase